MQAIQTHYLGPTDYRGSRIVAKADAGRLVVSWNYALGVEENHRAAALALRDRLGWAEGLYGDLATGYLPGGTYAHVFVKSGGA